MSEWIISSSVVITAVLLIRFCFKERIGAKLRYACMIPGDGRGDHPAFMIVRQASEALARIGMELVVLDLSNSAELWDALENIKAEIWAAAWGAAADPDMYQIYYSDKANSGTSTGQNPYGGKDQGGSNYQYCIADEELDSLIMQARSTTNQSVRAKFYKACLDIVADWAVEVPTYQRQNAVLFSAARIDTASITKDITVYYGWMSEIENIRMVQ